jgi:hypothetical protein
MEHTHRVGYFRHSFGRPELHIFVPAETAEFLTTTSASGNALQQRKGHFQFLVAQPEQAGFGPSANKEGRD